MAMYDPDTGLKTYFSFLWKIKQPLILLVLVLVAYLNKANLTEAYTDHRNLAMALGAIVGLLLVGEIAFLSRTRKYLPGHSFGEKFKASFKDRYSPFVTGAEISLIIGYVLYSYTSLYDGILPDLSWHSWTWALFVATGVGWCAKAPAKRRRNTQSVESFARGVALCATAFLLVVKLSAHGAAAMTLVYAVMAAAMMSLTWVASELYDSEEARHQERIALREGKLPDRRHEDAGPDDGIDRRMPDEDDDLRVGEVYQPTPIYTPAADNPPHGLDLNQPIRNASERARVLAHFRVTEGELTTMLATMDNTLESVGDLPLQHLYDSLEQVSAGRV